MLRSIQKNEEAILDLTLSQIGLMIATAILLAAVVSFISFNDMQRRMELESVASTISTLIETMDTKTIENTTVYWLPDLGYDYTVKISAEYVTVSAKGFWNNELIVRERFTVKPWPQDELYNTEWIGSKELHELINRIYGKPATLMNPIQTRWDWIRIKETLEEAKKSDASRLAEEPITLKNNKPVFIDKTILYYYSPTKFTQYKNGSEYIKEGEWSIFDFFKIWFGDLFGWLFGGFGGRIEIPEGTTFVYMTNGPLGVGHVGVTYQHVIPYTPEDVKTLDICVYYRADYDFHGQSKDPGPQLLILDWTTKNLNYLDEDGLGYTEEDRWYNISINHPHSYVNSTNGWLFIVLQTKPPVCMTDVTIHKVCIHATPEAHTYSEKQEFVLIYQ
jgi:hypothetical protein